MSEGIERRIKMTAGITGSISINSLKQTHQTYFLGNSYYPYILLIKMSSFPYLKYKINNWQRT